MDRRLKDKKQKINSIKGKCCASLQREKIVLFSLNWSIFVICVTVRYLCVVKWQDGAIIQTMRNEMSFISIEGGRKLFAFVRYCVDGQHAIEWWERVNVNVYSKLKARQSKSWLKSEIPKIQYTNIEHRESKQQNEVKPIYRNKTKKEAFPFPSSRTVQYNDGLDASTFHFDGKVL